MNKSKNILTFFLFLCSLLFSGTDGTIRGKVTDIEGGPLPGANIYIPDVGTGAAADMDGNYIMLNIPVGGVRCCRSNDGLPKANNDRC